MTDEAERGRRASRFVLTLAIVGLALWISAGFLRALVWGAIIAVAIDPAYQRAERRWPQYRTLLLPGVVTIGLFLLLIVPIGIGLVQLPREAHVVAAWLETARHEGVPVPSWVAQLPIGADAVTAWWGQTLATPAGAEGWIRRLDHSAVAHSRPLGTAVLHGIVIFVFALATLFFLLRDRDRLLVQTAAVSDRLFGHVGARLALQVLRSVQGTVNGLVLVGLGEGIALGIAYALFGVPHAALLGALTAVGAMIPLGAALFVAVAALLLLGSGHAAGAAGVVAIGLLVIGVADHVFRPILIGGTTRLPFLWVLIGILGGVESLGVLGLFVGPAAMAASIMLWREYVASHAAATGAAPGPGD